MRAKAWARVYEDYNQMEVNGEVEEVESNVYEEKVQQRWRYKDQSRKTSQEMLKITNQKSRLCPRKRSPSYWLEADQKQLEVMEYGHLLDKTQPDMAAMTTKLVRQQAAPDVDIDIFTGDPVDYHCSIAVLK